MNLRYSSVPTQSAVGGQELKTRLWEKGLPKSDFLYSAAGPGRIRKHSARMQQQRNETDDDERKRGERGGEGQERREQGEGGERKRGERRKRKGRKGRGRTGREQERKWGG